MTTQVFRANVGIVILGEDRRVLEFERSDIPGAWQLPQGGIDDGEEPLIAALRELGEETGLQPDDVALLGEHPEWLSYELPAELRRDSATRGQTQQWFYFKLLEGAREINLYADSHQEFSTYRWTTLADLAERTVSFRQPVYRALARHLTTLADRTTTK